MRGIRGECHEKTWESTWDLRRSSFQENLGDTAYSFSNSFTSAGVGSFIIYDLRDGWKQGQP